MGGPTDPSDRWRLKGWRALLAQGICTFPPLISVGLPLFWLVNSLDQLRNESFGELLELSSHSLMLAVIGAGLAVIGVIGSGIGIGNIFSSFIEAVGRNPAARGEVFTMTMLGFALVEAIALFALVIALVILFG